MPQGDNCHIFLVMEQPKVCNPLCHSDAIGLSSADCLMLRPIMPGKHRWRTRDSVGSSKASMGFTNGFMPPKLVTSSEVRGEFSLWLSG